MIEILVTPSGDRAEAETPEGAVLAARTLLTEARQAGCGRPVVSFYVEGKLVADGLPIQRIY